MTEKILHIEAIDPLELFGVNNSKLKLIKKAFPKIQLISRGHELKIIGDEQHIIQFEEKLNNIIAFFDRFNRLTKDDIEQLLNAKKTDTKSQENIDDLILFGNNGKPIKALTKNQKHFVNQSYKNDLVFALGPAGSGKTYTAIALAVRALRNREVKRIILSRPAVEAGERLGFLPGDLKEKIDPYLQPLYDALHDMIPKKKLESYIEEGIVQIAPLAFMRGRTLDDAYVILDEAQNTTLLQMKMFLTRMGMNAKFIVTGDVTQVDLPKVQDSGLVQSLRILENINGISVVELDETDIVRHRLVKAIVLAYEKHTH
ncbi:MAG: PhoH family protein [Salinivirgaceae bacterium]|jgi:phosphate starvation-inducible PhoH-like protein|nr:PhoH family protein [Salinivirgaceae bacterium]